MDFPARQEKTDTHSQAETLLTTAWAERSHDLEKTHHLTLEALTQPDLSSQLHAMAQRNLGLVFMRRAEYSLAAETLDLGLALAQTAGAEAVEGDCRALRAMVHSALGDYSKAIETQLAALELRQRIGDAIGEGQSLGNLGVLYSYIGDYTASLEYHMRALDRRERSGDQTGRALTLNNIGVAYYELGETESAIEYHSRALDAAKASANYQVEIYAQVNLAADLNVIGQYEQARLASSTALEQSLKIGDRETQIEARIRQGRALLGLGLVDAAFASLDQGLHEVREIGNPALEYLCLAETGRAHLSLGQTDEAVQCLTSALECAEAIGIKRDVYLTHQQLSAAYERQGNAVSALHHHHEFYSVEREVQGERMDARAKTLVLRFEADRARQEALTERQRNEDLAAANAALHRANEEKSRLMEKLGHQAQHDGLTGLPNRSLFQDRLERAVTAAARYGRKLGVMFVDLDGFKLVNDTLGHHRGDELLVEVARRFQTAVRDSDTVARMGGDEFTVILSELQDSGDAARVAQRLIETLGTPIRLDEREITITASIGVSLYPQDGEGADDLARHADLALYRAKDEGKNTVRFYAPEMNGVVQERMQLESYLRGALDRNEFQLCFQPIVGVDGHALTVEALLRWTHPILGRVGPDRFIPAAEDTGQIVPIGTWVLRAALAQVVSWRARGYAVGRVAVNVSPIQLARENFVDTVIAALNEYDLPGSSLELEITERTLVRDLQRVSVRLETLQRLGVTVAVDDFGAGHSSLSYLAQLPVNVLKVDRGLISTLMSGGAGTRLVKAILALSRALELEVVAEGVETEAQLRTLTALGCQRFQGYLWTKPVPPSELGAWFPVVPNVTGRA